MIQSRQVEAFRAVMLTGAMTAAADTLGVTQPAVSRLIRDFEAELGVALFLRRGNLVVPTAQAFDLLREVERSFVGLQQIRAFASELRAGQGGCLKVAALPAVSASFLPRFLAQFSRERPNLRIVVDGLSSAVIRERVSASHFDLGIVSYPFSNGALTITPVGDGAVVAMPIGHRLAEVAVVRLDDLRDERVILLSRFTTGVQAIDIALQSLPNRLPIETPLANIACSLVAEGMGLAIVDVFSAIEFEGRGLVVRPFEPSLIIGTAVIHSSERPLSVIAQQFHTELIESMQDHARATSMRLPRDGGPGPKMAGKS